MKCTFVLLAIVCNINAAINSGCPLWGCMSSGSFSLSSEVPPNAGVFKWSTEIADVREALDVENLRGCVSGQLAIVCSMHNGYISLDPATGNQMWNHTSMNYPYLPVMDVAGDIFGMDEKQLVYVADNGFSPNAINISVLKPAFSLMLANNSILLITASQTDTGQIVTYDLDGIICGALSLKGTVHNISGTFVPAGHPIIVGYRAYVITKFDPDVGRRLPIRKVEIDVYRLYALDLWNHMVTRIKLAWYFNLGPVRHQDDQNNAVVTYFRGTIYVNIPNGISGQRSGQRYEGLLWGLRDDGDNASLLFCNFSAFGQMVVYYRHSPLDVNQNVESAQTLEVSSKNHVCADVDQTIWVTSTQQNLISGYSSKNGSFRGYINITELTNIDTLTSKLAITRQSEKSPNDVLVFGGNDRSGGAYLVALETDSSANVRLLWKTKVSDEFQNQNNATWKIVGQIVNTAQAIPSFNGTAIKWQFGVIAMVVESGQGYTKLHIKAVF